MALRLFLVSVVAGLGLSLPSGARVSGWKEQAQAWVSARLADWDAQKAAHESEFVYITDVAPTAPQHAPAAAPAATTAAAPAPPPAPTPAPARPAVVTAALCMPTGLDLAELDLPLALAEASVPADAEPTAPAAAVAPAPAPEPVKVSDVAFDAALDAVVADFAHDRPAAPAVIEPMKVGDDFSNDLASVLNRENEGLDLGAKAETPVAPRFEPLVVADDLYVGEAYALNRAAEGLDLKTPAPAPVPVAAVPATNLTRAVKLTREAVFAWASLLHGPAVVTIPR